MSLSHLCPRCSRSVDVAQGQTAACPSCGYRLEAVPTSETSSSTGALEDAATRVVATPLPTAPSRNRPPSPPIAPDPSAVELAREVAAARADPARVLGPFVLLTELGKGGMGVVHRAWDDRLKRVVALKTILPGAGSEDEQTVQRFRREAEAVARLRHPNIVAVHEAGELARPGAPGSTVHYIAMDFVNGRTLEQRLREGEGRLSPSRAIEVVRDVARAVQYAHEHGVVHRDLKPQNILLDAHDRPFVLDFGLATVRGRGTRVTRTGTRLGTPAYMPPEQASGEGADERSDVYALGATLYHVLTGRPPFDGEAEYNVLVAVLTRDPVAPRSLDARVAADLETVCLKCLEKEPAKRYPSAASAADDIDHYLRGEPIAARPVGPLGRLARKARRNKLATTLVFVVLAAVVLAVGAFVSAEARAREELARAHEQLVEGARVRARATREKLERARSEPGGGASREKMDELLALALEASEAGSRFADVEPGPESRASATDASIALARVALDAEEWSLAASSYRRALDLTPDDTRARVGLDEVSVRRQAVQAEHAAIVSSTIASVISGAGAYDHDDALYRLVRLAEPQTVRLLADEVSRAAEDMNAVRRELFLAVVEPTPAEARTGATRLEGLSDALERSTTPGAETTKEDREVLHRAEHRISARKAREPRFEGVGVASVNSLVATAQFVKLGPGRIEAVRLACEALGRIGIAPGAVPALAAYLYADADPVRALAAALALCRLKDEKGVRLLRMSLAFQRSASFKIQIRRAFARLGIPEPEPRTAADFLERARMHRVKSERDEALADFARAIELGSNEARVARGAYRVALGDWKGAIEDLTHAVEADPEDCESFSYRGEARSRIGDFKGALEDCDRAVNLHPRGASHRVYRATVREAAGDMPGALEDLDEAVALDTSSALAVTKRADLRRDRGDLDGAIADYTRAIELDPTSAWVWVDRGDARRRKGDRVAAIADYTRAIELVPGTAELWSRRALARNESGDHDGAIADETKAIEIRPRNADHWCNRGVYRDWKGDTEGALADFDRTIELNPRHGWALYRRGVARHRKGDFQGALSDFTGAVEALPKHARIWGDRGSARVQAGDRDGGLADCSHAIELDPKDGYLWYLRGLVRDKRGELAQAIEDYSRAIEIDPKDGIAIVSRAIARNALGDLEGTIKDCDLALELDSHALDCWFMRGRARFRLKGDVAGALADVSRAIELAPDRADFWRERASLRERAGDKQGAVSDLERCLELEPNASDVASLRATLERLKAP